MTYRTRKILALILAAPVALPFIAGAALLGLLWLGLKSWGRIVLELASDRPTAPPLPGLTPDGPPPAAHISPPSTRATPPPGGKS